MNFLFIIHNKYLKASGIRTHNIFHTFKYKKSSPSSKSKLAKNFLER